MGAPLCSPRPALEVHFGASSPVWALPPLAVFRAGSPFAPARLPLSCQGGGSVSSPSVCWGCNGQL
eukprot:15453904-Alexandrium_andersonii.AAC.1